MRASLLLAITCGSTISLSAQQIPLGFGAPDTAAQRAFEQRLLAIPDTLSPRELTRTLTRVPHMAGTPAQAATRDEVIAQMSRWGLATSVKAYDVYIPQVDTVRAWLLAKHGAAPQALVLGEPRVTSDPVTRGPQIPPFNGYTASGDVTAPVVFVNFGLIEDYKTLDSLGISVKGKIAIARYGR